jgi:hypothetical protein
MPPNKKQIPARMKPRMKSSATLLYQLEATGKKLPPR